MLETMMALLLMCLIFFGAMQLFLWGYAQMFCTYAAFYAGKAYSLGYADSIMEKAAYIAAIPISGPDISGSTDKTLDLVPLELEIRLRNYMSAGSGAGVKYEYWKMKSVYSGGETYLDVRKNNGMASVELRNAPFLEGLGNFFRKINIRSEVQAIDHGKEFLE